MMKKIKKPLLFVLALIPIAIVGGYFTSVYGWDELTENVKSQIMVQIGNNLNLFYLVAVMQTLVYTSILGFVGYLISDKLGLMKPLKLEKKPVVITLSLTLLTGLVLSSDIFFFKNDIPQIGAMYSEKPSFAYWMSSILYGGIIEEVMLRLFVMSLLALIIWKVFFRKEKTVPTKVLIIANIVAAIMFAAGHLPATIQMFGEITVLILFRCFLLNGVGGVVFGYLYRKFGIQYSMMAHAGAHIVWKTLWILLL